MFVASTVACLSARLVVSASLYSYALRLFVSNLSLLSWLVGFLAAAGRPVLSTRCSVLSLFEFVCFLDFFLCFCSLLFCAACLLLLLELYKSFSNHLYANSLCCLLLSVFSYVFRFCSLSIRSCLVSTNKQFQWSNHSSCSIPCSLSVGSAGQRDVSDMATQAFERLFATQLSDIWYMDLHSMPRNIFPKANKLVKCGDWKMSGRISILGCGVSALMVRSLSPCHFHPRAPHAWH